MAASLHKKTPAKQAADAALKDWRHTALDARPGFLIRRLHQIHVALFVEECAPEGITPVQYSILTALEQMGPSEQIALSRAVGLDRANTADVIGRLVERRFIQRRVSRTDKRKKVAELTEVARSPHCRRKTARASWRISCCSSKPTTT
jgi:MarR family transcriptional regulator, lower aerobic nicotinate degradation pathway regulator